MPTEDKAKTRKLVLDALDGAFQEHFRKLFAVWLTDDLEQPQRAQRGAQKALKIYREAMDLVEKTEL